MAKIDELRKKYPNVVMSVADRFFEGDKTPTKKYLEFMFKIFFGWCFISFKKFITYGFGNVWVFFP